MPGRVARRDIITLPAGTVTLTTIDNSSGSMSGCRG